MATIWWSSRLWRRRKELAVRTRVVAVAVTVSAISGVLGTIVGLLKIFALMGGESADPSQTARLFAEGISEAINCIAIGVVAWVLSASALVFLTRRLPKAQAQPRAEA